MKRIYVILFAAALSASAFSCKEKNASEQAKEHLHETGEDIKDATHDEKGAIKEDIKEEEKKTTKNGDDAH